MLPSSELALALAAARKSGEKLAEYPGEKPATLVAALELQLEVARALGWRRCGWKVGATSAKAQAALNVSAPFAAPLFSERVFRSGDAIDALPSNSRIVEPELAFVMRSAPPPSATAYSARDVLACVATVHAAFELVNPRLPLGLREPVEWLIADGGINDAFVLGLGIAAHAELDYAGIQVQARRNAEVITRGAGVNVLGGPELVLTWLANHLRERGLALAQGDVVSTGLLTDVIFAQPGDEITADFSGIGGVCVRY